MKRLLVTLLLIAVMLPLTSISELLACSCNSPLYTHFVYLLGHASILHWACNSWSLLVLHNLFSRYRMAAAYICAVAVSFIPSARPVIGVSVIVCFFIGFYLTVLWKQNRTAVFLTAALLLLSCALPGFAGFYHIITAVCGFTFFEFEMSVRNFLYHEKQY